MRHVIVIAAALTMVSAPALAQDSIEHVSKAAEASGAAVAHLTVAGVEAVSGVVALPLGIAGGASQAVGAIAQAGGESLQVVGVDSQRAADQALTDSWGPLAVDRRVIVRPDPPPQVPYAPGRPVGR
jgi:hypothetical protein